MTWLLVILIVLVLLDDLNLRRSMQSQDERWLSVLGAKDEKIRRLRRRIRRLLPQQPS